MNFQLKIAQKEVLVKKDLVLGLFDQRVFFKHFSLSLSLYQNRINQIK